MYLREGLKCGRCALLLVVASALALRIAVHFVYQGVTFANAKGCQTFGHRNSINFARGTFNLFVLLWQSSELTVLPTAGTRVDASREKESLAVVQFCLKHTN